MVAPRRNIHSRPRGPGTAGLRGTHPIASAIGSLKMYILQVVPSLGSVQVGRLMTHRRGDEMVRTAFLKPLLLGPLFSA